MINTKERVEADRQQGIEDIFKKAREELIRRKIINLIFEKTTNQLVHTTYSIEMQKAQENIMYSASSYLKILTTKQNELVLSIYPSVYSLFLYPELREQAVQSVLRPCIMKAMQFNQTQDELKKQVISSLSQMLMQRTVTLTENQITIEGRILHDI